MITIDEFRKIEIRMGKVVSCEKVEGADKLLRLKVDFGPSTSVRQAQDKGSGSSRIKRQIIAGLALCYSPEELIGKTLPFVVNLEYRKFKGEESQGMLVATGTGADNVVLLEPNREIAPGAEVV